MKQLSIKSTLWPFSFRRKQRKSAGISLLLILSVLFLGSCQKEETVNEKGDPAFGAKGETVAHKLSISDIVMAPVANTQRAAEVTTSRAANSDADTNSAMDIAFGAQTRAAGELTSDEKTLKTAYVLQFDGTEPGSKLVNKSGGGELAAQLSTGEPVEFEFVTTDKTQRVYLVANMDVTSLTTNTTLSDFEAKLLPFAPSMGIPANGLPMLGSQEFNPSIEYPASFTLNVLVSKLTVSCNAASLKPGTVIVTLKSIASGYSAKQAPAGAVAAPVPGVTYSALALPENVATGTPCTVYLSPNLSGQVASITRETDRSAAIAPANSTFIEITGSDKLGEHVYGYHLSLGSGDVKDFNVAGSSSYNITVTLKGTNELDKRVTKYTNLGGADGTANCYIIGTKAGSYSFDATVQGNGVTIPGYTKNDKTIPALTPVVMNPKGARLLWETGNKANVTATNVRITSDGKIYFDAPSLPNGGSCVLAATDATNTILWSWHIWRPFVSANDNPQLKIKVKKWDRNNLGGEEFFEIMDRHLGARLSGNGGGGFGNRDFHGFAYQWGRKDPFWYHDKNITPSNRFVSHHGMAAYDDGLPFREPYRFFLVVGSGGGKMWYNGDWLPASSGQWDHLWGNPELETVNVVPGVEVAKTAGKKSMYDPCPPGFRVPPNDTFSKMFNIEGVRVGSFHNTNGFNLPMRETGGTDVYFARTLFLQSDLGRPEPYFQQDAWGIWNSSPDSNYMRFPSSDPSGRTIILRTNAFIKYRDNALSIRCVSESVSDK